MKLTFSWQDAAGRETPCCSSVIVNKDGVSLLACLLMDDGGQGYLGTVPWIDEGIAKVDAVLGGEITEGNWDRDDWGAKLKSDEAVIYSLNDEDYKEVIDLTVLRRALVAWREFVQSVPDTNIKKEVEI
ncbi:hypothetical protein C0Z18_21280 [Trinickia dabaoshanensis]|uniref:Uncharacterized protein n=1 Tax=Trinickia dabaoshanensis TaxID=564714 RepID=A0A2N7VIM3_9BURK|nr:hypothetical protein [Trinickia dabaoshanensis]PMS17003.1 hypothetical protein C0Z18_21280 [Trinickia dabaoshanensis]